MKERRGVTHINMTDLLQQYSVGNGERFADNKLVSETILMPAQVLCAISQGRCLARQHAGDHLKTAVSSLFFLTGRV